MFIYVLCATFAVGAMAVAALSMVSIQSVQLPLAFFSKQYSYTKPRSGNELFWNSMNNATLLMLLLIHCCCITVDPLFNSCDVFVLLTLVSLTVFGLGWPSSVPLISVRKYRSNFLRLSPVMVPPMVHTRLNRNKPCSHSVIWNTHACKCRTLTTRPSLYCPSK